jgi:hypothetical protein
LPRIPDQLLGSVAFVFPDEASASAGRSAGGTGFVVEYKASGAVAPKRLLVTNTHVAQGRPRTVRLSDLSGNARLHNVQAIEWHSHPNGDDISVAVLPAGLAASVAALEWSALAVTSPRMTELNMGVGDEVIMLGRFLSRETVQISQPLARFGNIAMMPGDPLRDGRGLDVEAFLVEMRSQSGFSGSPAFVYMGPGTYRGNGTMMPFYSETIGLMGIDTGHKAIVAPVQRRGEGAETDFVVPLNTGISMVAPAWRIAELLDLAVN